MLDKVINKHTCTELVAAVSWSKLPETKSVNPRSSIGEDLSLHSFL